jgi:MFS family permease
VHPEPDLQPTRVFTRRFAVLLVAQACFGYCFSTFFLLPKYLASELGAGPASVGLLQAANGLSAFVFMFACGILVDRFGRRRFLTAGAALMAVSSFGFLWVDSIGPLIYALRVLQGLAFSMAFVGGATLAVDQAPPERLGQALGFFGLTMLSMNAIAPVVTESLAALQGWPAAFGWAALGGAISVVLSRFVHEKPREHVSSDGLAGLLRVARRPAQVRAAIVILLVGGCFGCLFTFHQLYALELGMPNVRVFFVAYACAAIATRLGFGHLGDRYGRSLVASLMLVLYSIGAFSMIALAEIGLAPIGALFGFAHGLFYPTYNAEVVDGAEENERGKIVALFQGWFNAGLTAGAFLLGFVAEIWGYPAVFVVAGCGVLVALVVMRSGRDEPSLGRQLQALRRSVST